MIALWILFGIVALVIALLFSPVIVSVRWFSKPQIKLRFWFICIDLLKERSPKPQRTAKQAKSTNNSAPNQQPKKKRSIREFLDFLRFLSRALSKPLGELISRLKIRIFCLNVRVATEDPARTAMLYGVTSSLVYQLCELVSRFTRCRIDYQKISVVSDFSSSQFNAELDARFSLRIIDLLGAGVQALSLLQPIKNYSGGTDNERNPIETSH